MCQNYKRYKSKRKFTKKLMGKSRNVFTSSLLASLRILQWNWKESRWGLCGLWEFFTKRFAMSFFKLFHFFSPARTSHGRQYFFLFTSFSWIYYSRCLIDMEPPHFFFNALRNAFIASNFGNNTFNCIFLMHFGTTITKLEVVLLLSFTFFTWPYCR